MTLLNLLGDAMLLGVCALTLFAGVLFGWALGRAWNRICGMVWR